MISIEDAIKELRKHDTLIGNNGRGYEVYHSLSFQEAQKIADLIEHLSSKCDLEVNELLGEDQSGRD